MTGICRYVAGDVLRGQGWVAPTLAFVAIDAIDSAQAGSVLPAFAISATALVFVGAWITVVVVNHEDAVAQSITESWVGNRTRVRLAKLGVAYAMTASLGILGLLGPPLASSGAPGAGVLTEGLFAQLVTAMAGVAIGSVCARPLVPRRAWSLLLGVLVCLVTVLLPDGIPSRQLLVMFNKTEHYAVGLPLLALGVETLALAAIVVALSSTFSLRRA